ncbi:kinase [Rozella allomycis CSF55]|uniref:Kinase n=1 Tax=Rozella allomycis (strain CSF55) TaxID=988480 RepID=A0A4P9YHE0_ROZAC|nr:kinase [Rozella allomycis CSF55]
MGKQIGKGSFGDVYLGLNAENGTLMAVKTVDLSNDSCIQKTKTVESLEKEIEVLKTLKHDNIVRYLGATRDETKLNILLEYVPGGSIASLLNTCGPFEELLMKNFARQMLSGLSYLHEQNIIHRFCGNFLLNEYGQVKISDFGLSLQLGASSKARHSIQGTVFWMAPEVLRGSITTKTDIWSFGCVLIEMLTANHPWTGCIQEAVMFKLGKHVHPDIPDNASDSLKQIMNLCFEKEPNSRPTAKEILKLPWTVQES